MEEDKYSNLPLILADQHLDLLAKNFDKFFDERHNALEDLLS